MEEIKLLSEDIINEIAAGEVIEKPSAVVKELIENSIDAKATNISIHIELGGIKKIIVSDDGIGIDKEYIFKAIQRHATSKMKNKTLENIVTLGFRGEALYSISNASELEIISKNKNMEEAWQINIAYGKILSNKPSKGTDGTQVIVKNLFENLPVRKKFLNSSRSEGMAIKNFVKKIALAYPKITFSFSHNKAEKLLLIGRQDEKSQKYRIKEVLGQEFIKSSVFIEQKKKEFHYTSHVSIPTFNKSNWKQTTIIINGRVIKDKALLGVIKAAYAGLLAGNRYPVVVMNINLDPQLLDINVHPSKTEVRILNRYLLNSSIIKNIREQFDKIGLRHSILDEKQLIRKFQIKNSTDLNQKTFEIPENPQKKFDEKKDNIYHKDESKEKFINHTLGSAKAQINNMFIVSQTNHSLILVDQHAAHERIVLENLKKSYYDNNVIRQISLIPVIVKLDDGKTELLESKKEIEKLGFIFEDYGDNSIIVRETPAILGKINISLLFEDLAEQIKKIGKINPLDTSIERILSSIACHNSVRAGRKLNIDEMNSILRLMEKTPNSGQCNHGRPTFIELKLSDVESLFGRT